MKNNPIGKNKSKSIRQYNILFRSNRKRFYKNIFYICKPDGLFSNKKGFIKQYKTLFFKNLKLGMFFVK
jgi:hypothetical protein